MPNSLRVVLIIILVLIIAIVVAVILADRQMQKQADKEAQAMLNSMATPLPQDIITTADLVGLPSCVQQWLRNSKVIGRERIHTVRLKQLGRMRSAEGKPWMPFEAVQYINVDQPGFVWQVRVKAAPFMHLRGKDKYDQGQGSMQIKVLALVPVVDAKPGKEMNEGSMMRYLAEMIWYPTVALKDYIKWEEIDSHSARATMTWQGVTASMVFNFNDAGDLVSNVGPRYQEVNGKFVLNDWGGICREYHEFNGIRISNKSDVIWKYKTGDFNWLQLEIVNIDFNQPQLY